MNGSGEAWDLTEELMGKIKPYLKPSVGTENNYNRVFEILISKFEEYEIKES